ncbi:MAG: hypothetical protein PVJ39_09320 [Gammaproteobacteria bacterium]
MKFQLIHRHISFLFQGVLLAGVIIAIWNHKWLTALITTGIIVLTLTPLLVARRLRVFIPPEFQLFAIAFVFASLFLGEVLGYYGRFWWWDIALHGASGFLLGIVGFLLVHVLNETEEIGVYMKPGFVAFFAFLFSIGIGTLWEIFEFSIDQLFRTNMQKTMFNDPSGLTDTMWDLIVDNIGAMVIAVLGYGYLQAAGNRSFLERWIHTFIQRNPRLFKHYQ